MSNTPARSSEYDDIEIKEDLEQGYSPQSPIYQESQLSSDTAYDIEKKFDTSSPNQVPSTPRSPEYDPAAVSESGFISSDQIEYTPSSPTESNESIIAKSK